MKDYAFYVTVTKRQSTYLHNAMPHTAMIIFS